MMTELADIQVLESTAIKAANSKSVSDVECCFDVLSYLKSLNFSCKDLRRHSRAVHDLVELRSHENPNIVMEVNVLLNSWIKTLYSTGGNPKKSEKNGDETSSQAHKTNLLQKLSGVQVFSKLNKTKEDERSIIHEIKQNPNDRKSKPIPTTKQSTENPKQNLKKNTREMLELFEIAKKSADVANVKGLLLSKAETSICVDTLSLFISFPISSTDTETRKIMGRLEHLTHHKDRKICNSASTLLHHWRQSIRESQSGKDKRGLL